MTRAIFVDTSYFIASVNPRDPLHGAVRRLNRSVRGVRLVTTDLVLVELLSYFAETEFLRVAAARAVTQLRRQPVYEIVEFNRAAFMAAFSVYEARPDKGYSLVDCHSMLVMKERGIQQVLSSDGHFEQAGFTCLLPTGGRHR